MISALKTKFAETDSASVLEGGWTVQAHAQHWVRTPIAQGVGMYVVAVKHVNWVLASLRRVMVRNVVMTVAAVAAARVLGVQCARTTNAWP